MIALLVVTAMGCGMRNLCRGRRTVNDEVSSPGYNVAVSNSIFREDSGSGREQMRCMNCILIEMGEMACYTERCPDCGRIPPGRKKQKPPDLLRKLVGRGLSVKKPTKPSQTAVMNFQMCIRMFSLLETETKQQVSGHFMLEIKGVSLQNTLFTSIKEYTSFHSLL